MPAPQNLSKEKPVHVKPEHLLQINDDEHTGSNNYQLSDDLIVSCNEYSEISSQAKQQLWQLDFQGWVFFHFRLEGVSKEHFSDGLISTLGSKTFILTNSNFNETHGRQLLGDSWRTVGILIKPHALKAFLPANDNIINKELRALLGEVDSDISCITGQLSNAMIHALSELLSPSVNQAFMETYIKAKTHELICLTLDSLINKTADNKALSIKLTKKDLNCLNYAKQLLTELDSLPSLTDFSRLVGINRNKLTQGFKCVFGSTMGEYHRNLRLDRAHERISNQESNIANIALEAGYKDHGSFSKAFKSRFGYLPSKMAKLRG